jgi:CubicO group peptidase (beta-lactamase class C family)
MSSTPLAALLVAALAIAALPDAARANALPAPATAPASNGGFSAERLERLHRFMRENTDAKGYLGGVTLVSRHGRIVDWKAYGFRDIARTQLMQHDDIFRIYSMTKTVATVALMMLVEEGKLTLDDPVSRFLPAFKDAKVLASGTADSPTLREAQGPIRIRHLLTHTAGFPAGLEGDHESGVLLERADPYSAQDLQGFVDRFATVPLAADPGTRFGYDGAAMEVAARVVEVISGQRFDVFLQARILDPLKMVDTSFRVPHEKRSRAVDITTMGDEGRLVIAEGPSGLLPGEPLHRYPSAANGLYSTAGDYARFCQMLLNGGSLDGVSILSRKSVDLMLRNQLTMLDPPVNQFSPAEGFGLGGYVVLDVARWGVAVSPGMFGWSGAASTTYFIDRKEDLYAIALMQHVPNEQPGDLPRLGRRIIALVYQSLEQ